MSTRKKKKSASKNYISITKYSNVILKDVVNYFIIKTQTKKQCKKTLKIAANKYRKNIMDFFMLKKQLTTGNPDFHKRLLINADITRKIISLLNTQSVYTFCLNQDNLILAENPPNAQSPINELLSKHLLICSNEVCVAGEMMVEENTLVFNNNSGSYKPNSSRLRILKKTFPFLKIKVSYLSDN